ncbi:hypothetical protein [Streptomyces sp. BPTC-684]|uniref:hypothetical protein n=1 Tax=Streptomyces sp. BPTC-684 TaxID=3043734 RepID=UPI0024B276FA|nr:hypothetical protein [Streptomyces sp. BPTC-684]WHM38155.1 hypothetical protein QIY60_15345 [Streptomyces sp. BPTC-684]
MDESSAFGYIPEHPETGEKVVFGGQEVTRSDPAEADAEGSSEDARLRRGWARPTEAGEFPPGYRD